MKKIFKSRILLLMAMIAISGFVTSCDNDDDEANSDEVVLLSFGPTGAQHGETIKFIGQNLDKVTSIVLPGVEVQKGQFTSASKTLIELVVPQETEEGKVILKTPDGDIESKTVLSFEVPVTISSITAEAKPGTNITIAGDHVNWITSVIFPDDLEVTEFESSSLGELVVKVPMEAKSGQLVIWTGGTDPQEIKSETDLVVTLPTITSLAPLSVKHESDLTITGTDLDLVTSVIFSGDFEVFEFVNQTIDQIVVKVPAGALKGKVTLVQASPITVTSTEEITIILPKGTSLNPRPASPGDDVTIAGTNLDLVAKLKFPGVTALVESSAFKSHSATQIVVTVPEGATAGGLGYETIHGYSNAVLGVNLITPGSGPPALPLTMYDETIAGGGGDWSWNVGTSDKVSTEQFYSGNVSWKFTTPSDGGVSVGGMSGINASGLTYFSFSVYGGPGTNGKQLAAILNDNWGEYSSVTIVEGQWKEFQVPLSTYETVNLASITRWIFKVEGMTGSTIYVDRIGFE